jgi:hypothetical protein
MTIDTSGKWWKSSAPEDLDEYLRALTAGGYRATEFRLSQCQCGGIRFFLEVEPDEGVAKRICEKCSTVHFICDSDEHWEDDLKMKKYKCITCKSKVTNIGVGFAFYEDTAEIHWLYVGNRCAECGTLGSMVDWKIGFEPSRYLLEKA